MGSGGRPAFLEWVRDLLSKISGAGWNLTEVNLFRGTHDGQRGFAMRTNIDQGHLALAQAKFEPVARVLDRLSKDFAKEYGRSSALERRGRMRQTAQNAYAVRYSLGHSHEARLSLTFMVVGEDADLILIQGQEGSGPRDIRADPGQVDQRVYRLDKVDDIKAAVREKIAAHLRAAEARH